MRYYLPKDRTTWMARLPLFGKTRRFSLETDWQPQAEKYAAMLEEMPFSVAGEKLLRTWWEERKLADSSRLTLADLWGAWNSAAREDALKALLQRARDTDLQALLPEYLAVLPHLGKGVSPTVALVAGRALRAYLGTGRFPASRFTADHIDTWLQGQHQRQSQSRRPMLAALRRFGDWLVTKKRVLSVNPARDVAAPGAKAPRVRFLELDEIQRVIAATAAPLYRRAFLLAYGGAIEQVGLERIRRRDVDMEHRTIQVRGAVGKGATRERSCRIDEWAWEQLAPDLRQMLPDALVCPKYRRATAWQQHHDALAACHLLDRGTTLHCARHAWAVRKARAGVPVEMIAYQLGHKDAKMALEVYARFVPKHDDWARWERIEQARTRVAEG